MTALGRRGGDASGAEVVVVAVPGPAISAALGRVAGLAGMKDGASIFYRFAVHGEL